MVKDQTIHTHTHFYVCIISTKKVTKITIINNGQKLLGK